MGTKKLQIQIHANSKIQPIITQQIILQIKMEQTTMAQTIMEPIIIHQTQPMQ